MMLLFSIFSVLYNFPTFFEITTVIDPETNSTVITGTSLRRNKVYFAIHKVYGKIAIDLIAYVLIIVLNTFIFVKMAHSTKLSKAPTGNNSIKRSSIVSSKVGGGRKYSEASTTHTTVYLDVPGRNSISASPRRVSRDFGKVLNFEHCYFKGSFRQ